ncbi:MAG: hypothetical protein P8M18_01070 [Woeseiaceae bacterium]|nr:hypothetical protein [Woeseiaceae bacterium]
MLQSRNHFVPTEETVPDLRMLGDPSNMADHGYNPYETWSNWRRKPSEGDD